MKLLIKNVHIADPQSDHNGRTVDIFIEDGLIKEIGTELTVAKATIVDGKGGMASPGFFDLNCHSGDPGLETKEDLATLTQAAAAGGFTGIAVMPDTKPVVQSKSAVEYILNRTRDNAVAVHPIGAVSQHLAGKDLAELYDMHLAGAVAFSDGNQPIADDGFMSRAMLYAQGFEGLLLAFPQNPSISLGAQIHESATSVLLGMKGSPALAEEMQVARDLFLAEYHGARVHITNISTVGAVDQIRKAKKKGVAVTCDVAVHHLVFTESALEGFDTNYKINPPLRGKQDVAALKAGLKDGTIDAISSQHMPHEIEYKAVEFQIARYGMISLQTVLPQLLTAGLTPEMIADKLSIQPRAILRLPVARMAVGNAANMVVYQPNEKWMFNEASNYSKSSNSPLFNTELTGKVTFAVLDTKHTQYESIH